MDRYPQIGFPKNITNIYISNLKIKTDDLTLGKMKDKLNRLFPQEYRIDESIYTSASIFIYFIYKKIKIIH